MSFLSVSLSFVLTLSCSHLRRRILLSFRLQFQRRLHARQIHAVPRSRRRLNRPVRNQAETTNGWRFFFSVAMNFITHILIFITPLLLLLLLRPPPPPLFFLFYRFAFQSRSSVSSVQYTKPRLRPTTALADGRRLRRVVICATGGERLTGTPLTA